MEVENFMFPGPVLFPSPQIFAFPAAKVFGDTQSGLFRLFFRLPDISLLPPRYFRGYSPLFPPKSRVSFPPHTSHSFFFFSPLRPFPFPSFRSFSVGDLTQLVSSHLKKAFSVPFPPVPFFVTPLRVFYQHPTSGRTVPPSWLEGFQPPGPPFFFHPAGPFASFSPFFLPR